MQNNNLTECGVRLIAGTVGHKTGIVELVEKSHAHCLKASFFFLQIIPKTTQTHTLYTRMSFDISLTIIYNIGQE